MDKFQKSRRQFMIRSAYVSVSVACLYSNKVIAFSKLSPDKNDISIYNTGFHIHGYIKDRISENLFIGNGVRVYSRHLGIFFSPDTLAPIQSRELNPYAMSLNDPINRVDLDGNLSQSAIITITLGALGLLVGLLTLGVGAATIFASMGVAAGALMIATGVASVVSSSLQITAGSIVDDDPAKARTLFYTSLGFDAAVLLFSLFSCVKTALTVGRILRRTNIETFHHSPHFIKAHGNVGLTATPGGVKFGRPAARYYIDNFTQQGVAVNGERILELYSCRSANFGIGSQAQAFANEFGRVNSSLHHVIGYKGTLNALNKIPVNFYPMTGTQAAISHHANVFLGATFPFFEATYGYLNSGLSLSHIRNLV